MKSDRVEVSFVMPCLNEEQTLPQCIAKARRAIDRHRLCAEIVVADNGSTDGSVRIAEELGARVVPVSERGYGAALMGGISAARGEYVIMGDADDSYDWSAVFPFIERLRANDDFVFGCRLPGGGGTILPGAMPWQNRWIGNPALTAIGRLFFGAPVSDFHCGLRAFRKTAFEALNLRTTGMEFASEMIVKATLQGHRISEVPITLYPHGRDRPPHLRRWRDGWRHLRFMLCLSPRWTLFVPGTVLFVVGALLGLLVAAGPFDVGRIRLDIHTLIGAGLLVIVGYQAMVVGAAMRIYALTEEIGPPSAGLQRAFGIFTLERGVLAGVLACIGGCAFLAVPVWRWIASDFGNLDVGLTLRPMIIGSVLLALGVETVLMSFVFSMMGIRHKRRE
jgi:Glycosyl transferase family 2